MAEDGVLVVGESPSLGRAIADLLEAEGLRCRCVPDLVGEPSLANLQYEYAVVVAASSGYVCPTGRRWLRGDMPGVALVVVGSRDPQVDVVPGLHPVPLPLHPPTLVATIRRLLRSGSPPGRTVRVSRQRSKSQR